MATLYTDRRMLDHVPPSSHPEKPERLAAVLRHLERTGQSTRCRLGTARPATDDELALVHPPGYVRSVARFEAAGGRQIESDTWMSTGSDLAARLAVGSAVDAVDAVVEGPDPIAFCAVRPPGHHALPGGPMGFCLYATVSVAARHALRIGIERVLIVDFDVHHGNGTQDVHYEDGRVGFLSIHRAPFYPGTGSVDETGSGAGLGWNRNVPLPYGVSRSDYRAAFRAALHAMADRVRPGLVLLSAGFDAHAEDPVGDLGLEVEDFVDLTADLRSVADTWSSGRLVSVLEGGYNVSRLAGCVSAHLDALGVASIMP